MIESAEGSFGSAMRRRLIEDFVVLYYNGSLKPNLAEKNPATGRDVEYLMDAPQFDRTKKPEIWSYSNAIGTGYQYRVVYKDRRFSDLERLMEVYSGAVQTAEEDKGLAEQSLYQLILLMIKEGRLPKTFKIQSAQEAQEQRVIAMVEELNKTMEELGKRVRAIEERLSAQTTSQPQSDAPQPQVVALPASQSTLLE
jgi:di/tripeptidase